jgi:hypothetical protein
MQPNTLARQGYIGTIFVKNIRKKSMQDSDPKQLEKRSRPDMKKSFPIHNTTLYGNFYIVIFDTDKG